MNAYEYTITVKFMEEDGLYRATIAELPDAKAYGDTSSEAYEMAIDTIETAAEAFEEMGRPFPQPIQEPDSDFSGRFTLRMPKTLHAALHNKADQEGVSLNSLMCNVLSSYHGFDYAVSQSLGGWSGQAAGDALKSILGGNTDKSKEPSISRTPVWINDVQSGYNYEALA